MKTKKVLFTASKTVVTFAVVSISILCISILYHLSNHNTSTQTIGHNENEYCSARRPASSSEEKLEVDISNCLNKSKIGLIEEIEKLVEDKEKLIESLNEKEIEEREARDKLYSLAPHLFQQNNHNSFYFRNMMLLQQQQQQQLQYYNSMIPKFAQFDANQVQFYMPPPQTLAPSQFDPIFENSSVGLNLHDSIFTQPFSFYNQTQYQPPIDQTPASFWTTKNSNYTRNSRYDFGTKSPHGIMTHLIQ